MNRMVQNLKAWIAILITVAVTACGSGDEYDGFDDTVGLSTPNKFLTFFNSQNGEYDQNDFAEAYYAAIDPMDARTTAQDYIALHGLENPDVHVIFRDAKDLGYGRDMYMRSYVNTTEGSSCGPPGAVTIAFFVRNFSVEIVEGVDYGPVNLEAAIEADLQYHVSTNAIEFGYGRDDVGEDCSPEPIAKFYTYQPVYNPSNADHPRLLRVDLDGRGEKAMPQPCITCHGGKLLPRDRNGNFVAMQAGDPNDLDNPDSNPDQIGDTKAHMHDFEVDSFEFSEKSGHRRVDYEEGLRLLNLAAYCTYPGSDTNAGCAAHGNGVGNSDGGQWSGEFARDLLLGWYGDALDVPGSVFDDSFVPPGWTPMGGAPANADELFTKVVGPNCIVCHGKRGTQLQSDADFSTWAKFISYADEIERLVFDEGRMPLSLQNYLNFWGDPEKAELLASSIQPDDVDELAEFQARRRDSNGKLIPPGRIVARAGPDRATMPNEAITLNAQASLFADTFRWSLISAPAGGEDAIISNPNSMRTDFSADTLTDVNDPYYVVRLIASSSVDGTQKSDDIKIVVASGLPAEAPRALTFYDDITNRFNTGCTICHKTQLDGGTAKIPVWWTEEQPFGTPPAVTSPQLGFYDQARARVNLEFIEGSLILKKPSGNHHNFQSGFDTSLGVGEFGRQDYDMFVNWIAEGASCGGDMNQCP
jgi:mono/diheme cytochrome c family protein